MLAPDSKNSMSMTTILLDAATFSLYYSRSSSVDFPPIVDLNVVFKFVFYTLNKDW